MTIQKVILQKESGSNNLTNRKDEKRLSDSFCSMNEKFFEIKIRISFLLVLSNPETFFSHTESPNHKVKGNYSARFFSGSF